MTKVERRKIEDTIEDAKANYKEKETLLVKKELIFILDKLYNQYNNLEEINKSHQEENGKLRKEIEELKEELNNSDRYAKTCNEKIEKEYKEAMKK